VSWEQQSEPRQLIGLLLTLGIMISGCGQPFSSQKSENVAVYEPLTKDHIIQYETDSVAREKLIEAIPRSVIDQFIEIDRLTAGVLHLNPITGELFLDLEDDSLYPFEELEQMGKELYKRMLDGDFDVSSHEFELVLPGTQRIRIKYHTHVVSHFANGSEIEVEPISETSDSLVLRNVTLRKRLGENYFTPMGSGIILGDSITQSTAVLTNRHVVEEGDIECLDSGITERDIIYIMPTNSCFVSPRYDVGIIPTNTSTNSLQQLFRSLTNPETFSVTHIPESIEDVIETVRNGSVYGELLTTRFLDDSEYGHNDLSEHRRANPQKFIVIPLDFVLDPTIGKNIEYEDQLVVLFPRNSSKSNVNDYGSSGSFIRLVDQQDGSSFAAVLSRKDPRLAGETSQSPDPTTNDITIADYLDARKNLSDPEYIPTEDIVRRVKLFEAVLTSLQGMYDISEQDAIEYLQSNDFVIGGIDVITQKTIRDLQNEIGQFSARLTNDRGEDVTIEPAPSRFDNYRFDSVEQFLLFSRLDFDEGSFGESLDKYLYITGQRLKNVLLTHEEKELIGEIFSSILDVTDSDYENLIEIYWKDVIDIRSDQTIVENIQQIARFLPDTNLSQEKQELIIADINQRLADMTVEEARMIYVQFSKKVTTESFGYLFQKHFLDHTQFTDQQKDSIVFGSLH
jgi:hypothetical protein